MGMIAILCCGLRIQSSGAPSTRGGREKAGPAGNCDRVKFEFGSVPTDGTGYERKQRDFGTSPIFGRFFA
jgi:hypothetical protein